MLLVALVLIIAVASFMAGKMYAKLSSEQSSSAHISMDVIRKIEDKMMESFNNSATLIEQDKPIEKGVALAVKAYKGPILNNDVKRTKYDEALYRLLKTLNKKEDNEYVYMSAKELSDEVGLYVQDYFVKIIIRPAIDKGLVVRLMKNGNKKGQRYALTDKGAEYLTEVNRSVKSLTTTESGKLMAVCTDNTVWISSDKDHSIWNRVPDDSMDMDQVS